MIAAICRGLFTIATLTTRAGQVRGYLSSAILLTIVGGWLFSLAPVTHAQGPNQIGLVVIHGDGNRVTRCIEFSEPELRGYDVLQRANLELSIDANSMGTTICRIDGEGCTVPQEDCFCGMNQDPPRYWSYWQVENGQWTYSNLGASSTIVKPGSIEGWVWGTGDEDEAQSPQPYSLDMICAPATATPQPTPTYPPTATNVPTPLSTDTPLPTPTWTPTYTPVPTIAPTFVQSVTPAWTPLLTVPSAEFPTPTWTPTETWTPEQQGGNVVATLTPTETSTETPIEVPVETATVVNVAMAAQPETPHSYALLMPVVQAAAPTMTSVPEVVAVETPVPPVVLADPVVEEPTATAEIVLIQPSPVVVVIEPVVSRVEATVEPEVPTVVVTPPAVAMVATSLPAATAAASALDPQMTRLLGMLAAAGLLVALPVGLLGVAVLAYWIGRKL
jgi:hypothetical protein